jgi:very-short-patch-repair endonuclease
MPTGPVHVTVIGGHRHSRPGLVVHRAFRLDPADHHRRHGLAVTSVARTVIDLAPGRGGDALAPLVDRALRRTSPTKLRDALARHQGRPATARIAALLDPARPSADAWSRAEERMLSLIGRAELPAPEVNVAFGRYVPDLLWRAERVIVEYDSNEYHSGPAAVRWDTARHNHFTSLGYAVLHVTWQELSTRPERMLVHVAAALALGGRA